MAELYDTAMSWAQDAAFFYAPICAAVVALCFTSFTVRKLAFAKYMDLFSPTYDPIVRADKTRFFADLAEVVSADPELRRRGRIRLCELGVGTGTNFQYYPRNVQLVAVDPNEGFVRYFERNRRNFTAAADDDTNEAKVDSHSKPEDEDGLALEKFIVAGGESLTREQIPDNSVDVVVTTLVMCSVDDHDGFLSQIKRILAPGGRFYFWEHVRAPEGTWDSRIQDFVSNGFFWTFCGCGCKVNRRPKEAILRAGFGRVEGVEEFEVGPLPKNFLYQYIFAHILKYHLRGVAIK